MVAVSNIESKVKALIEEKIQDLGYELYDVEYLKEGKEYHLCIYIEKDGLIDINDCEKVNNVIEPILDEKDIIKEQYFLEVSSTGLEKKLRTIEHFRKQVGNEIEIKLFVKIENKKILTGILKSVDNNLIIIYENDKEIKIPFNQIAGAKTIYDWNA